ncbi:MAG: magnesium transporter [Rhodospirillaceae bacterium]|nr:magnesium transporter [Rhodospirillaceae bacterium]MYF86999.1 magnesium transporter [Rhodospirillaceae bacterium]MYH35449.1 magnesium transporter [Rhodospirillaceae bacterium]MYK12989.1 magnesium transporter [Rhodospirillaceae bacterium]
MAGTIENATSETERRLEAEFFSSHPAAATESLELLDTAERVAVLERQPVNMMLPVWGRLSPDIGSRLLCELSAQVAAETMRRLDPGRVARLLAACDEGEREELLALAGERTAREVRSLMDYPPDRAGAMMDGRVNLFRQSATVADVVSRLRQDRRPGRTGCFVVDSENRLAGWVDMQSIALAGPEERIDGLVQPIQATVDPMSTSEEVGDFLEKHRLADLAVVDADGRLVGAIRHAAVVEAELEQASLGIQTMVGVSRDERATSPVSFAVRKRLPWLEINLVTAFVAAAVVGLFESTIAQYTALAVLLPVVAGQSGNTGAQALAVTMRGLALREVRTSQWLQVVFKEANVGFLNGVAVALTTALGVYVWSGSDGLAYIIAASMVVSMVIAGISGAAIPMILTTLGQDPAQSSSILLTTVTDVAGFFSFLGIATLLAGLI